MVSWAEIGVSITKNPRSGYNVPVLKIHSEYIKPIERFPIQYIESEKPPTTDTKTPSSVTIRTPVAPIRKPVASATPTNVALPTIIPPKPTLSIPKALKHQVDPVVLGMPEMLYENAPGQMRRQMECEEAQRMEGLIPSLYASQGGRSRGWTKTGLEAYIKPRCSSGGDLRALDKSKSTFPWPLVRTDKTASAFLDFLCVAKGIRIAVWIESESIVMVYPAADKSGDATLSYPMYHVSDNGFLRKDDRVRNGRELLDVCEANKYTYLPPHSVSHSLSNLTVGELASVAEKLGMGELSGTKVERVGKISQYKLRQRLLSSVV